MIRAQLHTIIAPAEVIRDLLCGPQQADEHCRGWRWSLYMQDSKKRMAAVNETAKRIIAERRARDEAAQSEAAVKEFAE